jgi:hypothetical protein
MFIRSKIINLDRARAKIRRIGPVVRKTAREMLTREARLVAISCAKSSQPFGTGADARRAGRFRTLSDIYRVYATPGHAYSDIGSQKAANAFWWAIKNGKADKALGILRWGGNLLRNVPIGSFDDGALHQQNRDPQTGRVRAKTPKLIVRDPSRIAPYVIERQDHVGFGKSGWSGIARQLGSIRGLKVSGDITANWITRQSGPGTVVWSGSVDHPVVTMTSKVRYASQILSERDKRIAISIAQSRLRRSLLTAVRAELRNARLAA